MDSTEFEYDNFTFEVFYTHQKGMKGDGYLQPDDNDRIDIEKIFLKSYDTDGLILELSEGVDIQYIVNQDITLASEVAIDKHILQLS
tara:strand:+ start:2424 stop:2684 length:261 start_codon:yes stop_codon:yes gene_type:complete